MSKLASKQAANIIISSARRYLRLGNPVHKHHAAAIWTFKRFGLKDITNYDQSLQKLWLEALETDSCQEIDKLISLYFAYNDVKNYKTAKLIEQLFNLGAIHTQRPMDGKDSEKYYQSLLEDNSYKLDYFDKLNLKQFSQQERFYMSMMLSFPLPWSALTKEFNNLTENLPKRFQRLKFLEQNLKPSSDLESFFESCDQISQESRLTLNNPQPEKKILLVEGITEQLAIPHLAKCIGFDFNKLGIVTINVGGKNQMLRHYRDWAEFSNLPVRVLLDSDASEQETEINKEIRREDMVLMVKEGEFEDCFDLESLVDLANQMLSLSQLPLSIDEFDTNERRIFELNRVWRSRGLGDFDKAAFANTIIDYIDSEAQVPDSLKSLIQSICD